MTGDWYKLRTLDGQCFHVPQYFHPVDAFNVVTGRYEAHEMNILREHFKPDNVIVEIGANIGYTARYALLEKLSANGLYVCIEPNPYVQKALQQNMQQGQMQAPNKNFQIVQAAICCPRLDGGTGDFVFQRNLGSHLATKIINSVNDNVVKVPLRSLSGVLSQVAPRGASMICDGEGAELEILKHDRQAFSKIRQIAIELHGPKITGQPETIEWMVSEFRKLGFSIRATKGDTLYFAPKP